MKYWWLWLIAALMLGGAGLNLSFLFITEDGLLTQSLNLGAGLVCVWSALNTFKSIGELKELDERFAQQVQQAPPTWVFTPMGIANNTGAAHPNNVLGGGVGTSIKGRPGYIEREED